MNKEQVNIVVDIVLDSLAKNGIKLNPSPEDKKNIIDLLAPVMENMELNDLKNPEMRKALTFTIFTAISLKQDPQFKNVAAQKNALDNVLIPLIKYLDSINPNQTAAHLKELEIQLKIFLDHLQPDPTKQKELEKSLPKLYPTPGGKKQQPPQDEEDMKMEYLIEMQQQRRQPQPTDRSPNNLFEAYKQATLFFTGDPRGFGEKIAEGLLTLGQTITATLDVIKTTNLDTADEKREKQQFAAQQKEKEEQSRESHEETQNYRTPTPLATKLKPPGVEKS